jgi:hypothetical protein
VLTSDNVEREFALLFPHKAEAVAEDAGTDPAGRVDWIFRHEVMREALGNDAALALVFEWIERVLGSEDEMIEYWAHVRMLGRTLTDPAWGPHIDTLGGPRLKRTLAE